MREVNYLIFLADIDKVSVFNVEGPPVPIPNTAVKLNRAYNTWLATAREDWSMLTLRETLFEFPFLT